MYFYISVEFICQRTRGDSEFPPFLHFTADSHFASIFLSRHALVLITRSVKTAFPSSAFGRWSLRFLPTPLLPLCHGFTLHDRLPFRFAFAFISCSASFHLASSRLSVRSVPLPSSGPRGLWVGLPQAFSNACPNILVTSAYGTLYSL